MAHPTKILDSLLVLSFQRGDKKALTLLFKRWNKKICVQAFRYTNDWDLAQDVTQDTWRTVLGKIHMLRDANEFGSWVMTIANRKALDYLKSNKKYIKVSYHQELDDSCSDIYETVSKEDKINSVLIALKALPLEQRIVLQLFYLEEYSMKDISKITGVTVNTIKTRLFRAREKLKLLIKK
ncbi:sigma-70 family RNA polymerase sigma factor [Croceitalea sp. P059]|uniref:RNA polymerase sigma factor n=1 Tax=Croceitalea sp. P059 TaxID=3075601 RepID=UPI0028842A54|nr:sigma-70 family RNA polymerase sigma factor [Croceitalea sp. P059]MDT0540224.1 sigma-70 family RNA polymerase sigma factor [Croceitalea sp. P059]